MTASSESKPNVTSLHDVLIQHQLVPPAGQWELKPIATGSTRRELWRRRHYQVITEGHIVCHLVTGRNLTHEYRLATDLHAACPKVSCRPLFHHADGGDTEWIGFEHFPGTSLDERVARGSLAPADWMAAIRRVQEALESTRRPSSYEALSAEVSALIQEALALPALREADRHLLHEHGQAILLTRVQTGSLTVRLTNGDFTGRNVLMNDAGELRLIDCEFAAWTHFGEADWLRLARFSLLPDGTVDLFHSELVAAGSTANELYLCLHHFLQVQQVEPDELGAEQHAKACQRLLHALAPASLFVSETLNEHKRNESALAERTAWAQSLENEFAHRTAWAASLDAELTATRQAVTRLQQEFADRTAWAKELDRELLATRSQCDRLAEEAGRLAINIQLSEVDKLKLAAELRALDQLRANHEEGAQILEAEQKRLQAELAGAQARIDTLVRELASRHASGLGK